MASQENTYDSKDLYLISSLADGLSLEDAAIVHGFPVEEARQRLIDISLMLATDPESIDPDGSDPLMFRGSASRSEAGWTDPRHPLTLKIALLDELVAKFSPDELRGLGKRLLHVADAADQNWRPENVRSSYRWPSAAARIERNSLELAKVAMLIIQFRQQRAKFLPPDARDGPAWDMLLELFVQFSGGASVSTKSLINVSKAPPTTALRYIEKLENEGLIERKTSEADQRVTLIDLTRKGVVAVGRALERFP